MLARDGALPTLLAWVSRLPCVPIDPDPADAEPQGIRAGSGSAAGLGLRPLTVHEALAHAQATRHVWACAWVCHTCVCVCVRVCVCVCVCVCVRVVDIVREFA